MIGAWVEGELGLRLHRRPLGLGNNMPIVQLCMSSSSVWGWCRSRSRSPGRGPSLRVLIPETRLVTERLRVREVDDDEGRRLGGSSAGCRSAVTWRRARIVVLSAQGMGVAAIAKVAFAGGPRPGSRPDGLGGLGWPRSPHWSRSGSSG
jgi:hypothetical protein